MSQPLNGSHFHPQELSAREIMEQSLGEMAEEIRHALPYGYQVIPYFTAVILKDGQIGYNGGVRIVEPCAQRALNYLRAFFPLF